MLYNKNVEILQGGKIKKFLIFGLNFLLVLQLIIVALFLDPQEAHAAPSTVGTSEATSGRATFKSFQRKTFYDSTNGNYWSFYHDGAQIVYKYSPDGAAWNAGGTIAVSTGDFSLWQNGTTVYLAYSGAAGANISIISGTASATEISFGGPSIVFTGTAYNAYVARGSDGYLWVSYRAADLVCVKRSTNINDITVWDAATTLVTGGNSSMQLAIILPTTDGDVMAVGGVYRNISSVYLFYASYDHNTGTWGATVTDMDSAITASSTAGAYVSAVSDSSGNIHFLYNSSVTGATGVYYNKYSGGAWGTAVRLDASGGGSVTITINPSGGNLWAFWIRTNVIYYKKGVSPYALANWDAAVTTLYSTGTNIYSTAGYNTTSSKVYLEWTNGAASPYNVYFDNSISASSVPDPPTIGAPQAASSSAIRWNFTDTAGDETGFRVYDAGDNLKATCATPDITYCDEEGLDTNTQYSGRYVVAYNGTGESAHSGTADSIYTLANVPSAPTVSAVSADKLKVAINVNSNPASTKFAIYNDTLSQYIQADGSSGAGEVWQDYATWGGASGIDNVGLSSSTTYSYKVKARNGDNVATALSVLASEQTNASSSGSGTLSPSSKRVLGTKKLIQKLNKEIEVLKETQNVKVKDAQQKVIGKIQIWINNLYKTFCVKVKYLIARAFLIKKR